MRQIPAGSPVGVLDPRYAGQSATNRWNDRGDATFYIAGDVGVALVEHARHYREERTPEMGRSVTERALYRPEIRLQAVLDLRDPQVCRALDMRAGPQSFLDEAYARTTANLARRTSAAEALPSSLPDTMAYFA